MRMLGESKFLVLIKGMREGDDSCITPGVQKLPISLFLGEVAYLVCVECLYLTKTMVVLFEV